MGSPKPKMAASIRRIREIFMQAWDPIGIRDMRGAEDEYDAYIMPVYSILREQPSEQALVDYLRWAETKRMELHPPAARLKLVAEQLLQIDVSHDEPYQ
jgi:hypothetical protein